MRVHPRRASSIFSAGLAGACGPASRTSPTACLVRRSRVGDRAGRLALLPRGAPVPRRPRTSRRLPGVRVGRQCLDGAPVVVYRTLDGLAGMVRPCLRRDLALLAPLTFLSFLNHAGPSPLHFLWGSAGLGLIVLGVGLAVHACVLAAFAPRHEIGMADNRPSLDVEDIRSLTALE